MKDKIFKLIIIGITIKFWKWLFANEREILLWNFIIDFFIGQAKQLSKRHTTKTGAAVNLIWKSTGPWWNATMLEKFREWLFPEMLLWLRTEPWGGTALHLLHFIMFMFPHTPQYIKSDRTWARDEKNIDLASIDLDLAWIQWPRVTTDELMKFSSKYFGYCSWRVLWCGSVCLFQ